MPLYNNNNNDDGCAAPLKKKIHYLQTSFKRYYYHIMTHDLLVNNITIISVWLCEFYYKKKNLNTINHKLFTRLRKVGFVKNRCYSLGT